MMIKWLLNVCRSFYPASVDKNIINSSSQLHTRMTTGEPIIAGCDEDEILEKATIATSILETLCATQSTESS